MILGWGGVLYKSAATIQWLKSTRSLVDDISKAAASLSPNSTTNLNSIFKNVPMNSGSTKIFSAAALDFSKGISNPLNDVIIFDGRVSAALGLLARRLLYPNPINSQFKFPKPVEAKRDASMPGYVAFPRMAGINNIERAEYARTASRCIQDALGIYTPSNEFVQVEKALFMIGYDVTNTCIKCSVNQKSAL